MNKKTSLFIAAVIAVTAFGFYSQTGVAKISRQIQISSLTTVAESGIKSDELKKLMNVAGGVNSPSIYTGGSSPNIYTRGSSPSVYTGGSSPSVYTGGSSPNVYTRGSSPNIYTHGFSMNSKMVDQFPSPKLAL